MHSVILDEKLVDELITRLKNPIYEVPSDEKIVEAVRDSSDALTALWRLRLMGYAKSHCQLGLQRAAERHVITLGSDLKLSVVA